MAKIETAKGTKDIPPEDMILREKILSILKKNFEIFGFNPLQTPTLEKFSTLSSKYTGGAEILKETFKLKDQGNRELGLRYDLTVPFCRFIAMNPQMKLPFKRYQIGESFRDGPISSNRLREFTQCDFDGVGLKSLAADAECVEMFLKCFKDLGLEATVYLNNRKILDEIMEKLWIKENVRDKVILAIDKIEKKSKKEVTDEIKQLKVNEDSIKKLFEIFENKGNNEEKISLIQDLVGYDSKGITELKAVLDLCPEKNVKFTPSLARGLSYYTGTIFEVYAKGIKNSIAAGGRYDNMVGGLLGSKQEYPALGGSFGLNVIVNALKEKIKETQKTVVKVYIIPIGLATSDIWDYLKLLRAEGIPTDVDLINRSISKNLNYANSLEIPYVILVGEDEKKKNKLKLRDMKSGKEEFLSIAEIINKLKD